MKSENINFILFNNTLYQKMESSAGRKKIPSIKLSVFVGAKKTGRVCRDKKTYC